MKIRRALADAALCGGLIGLLTAGGCSSPADESATKRPEPRPDGVAIYDDKPDHLWNRLHQALFVRTTRDGKTLGQDAVDPLLWPRTNHLLAGRSHDEAVRLLDEFLKPDGDAQVRDPLKRAVLQHDLWAVLDWTAYPYGNRYGTEEHADARRALQRRLAPAVHRLALRAADVDALPDNYAAAVKAKAFAARFDPDHPETPFLPDDLFDPDGPWVCVAGPRDGPAATALTHARFFSGRSVFLVFIRLPGGRKETLAYLDKLDNAPSPWVLQRRKPGEVSRKDLLALSPDLPQFPAGTQVALVRQMVLVTDEGQPAAAPVTESVQVRVYRRIRPLGVETPEEVANAQAFVEFDLRRSDLFAGKNGGLHPVPPDEPAYLALNFLTNAKDPFEGDKEERDSQLMPVLKTCAACHAEPGVYSVHSFTRRFSSRGDPQVELALWPSDVKDERQKVLEWKQDRYDWGLLQGLSAR